MATRADVINLALRRLNVQATDEAATADESEYCGSVLDALFEELKGNSGGMTITWTLATTPQANLVPLANLLACEVAAHYEAPLPEPRSRAMARFRASQILDDRADRRDLDDDGTVTDAEIEASARAAFF